jgi:hypothetical protein
MGSNKLGTDENDAEVDGNVALDEPLMYDNTIQSAHDKED